MSSIAKSGLLQVVAVCVAGILIAGLPLATLADQAKGLDEQVRKAKEEVLDIGTELQTLEDRLLYPAYTQIAIYLSLKDGGPFDLASLAISIDGKEVIHHKYAPMEISALKNGGVQRLYTGNIKLREHKLDLHVVGRLSNNQTAQRRISYTVVKGVHPAIIEIRLASLEQENGIEFFER
ncbi:MAG: hypothetical protein OEZ10_03290 [Gammaproteobacteria bacterium]|nr:hypothetical protein [Gammaproteobacteria bacterium]